MCVALRESRAFVEVEPFNNERTYATAHRGSMKAISETSKR